MHWPRWTPSRDRRPPVSATPEALTSIVAAVDERIAEVVTSEADRWDTVDPRVGEAVRELARHTEHGGKRIRAAFCLWSRRGAAARSGLPIEDPDPIGLDVAAACEFLQTFALIHDDVMDNATIRRGQPTLHVRHADRLIAEQWKGEARRYGEGVAMLLGDLAHVYADRLVRAGTDTTLRIWDEMRIEVNLGQYLDMRSAAAGDLDEATARSVTTFKTALYTIVRPLQLGASLAGDDPALFEQLDRLGRPIGQAFQLRDDVLGVLGEPTVLGKPVGGDLREGKPTEVLAVARARAGADQRAILARVGDADLSDDDVAEMVEVFHATDAFTEVGRRIDELLAGSSERIGALGFPQDVSDALLELSSFVGARPY